MCAGKDGAIAKISIAAYREAKLGHNNEIILKGRLRSINPQLAITVMMNRNKTNHTTRQRITAASRFYLILNVAVFVNALFLRQEGMKWPIARPAATKMSRFGSMLYNSPRIENNDGDNNTTNKNDVNSGLEKFLKGIQSEPQADSVTDANANKFNMAQRLESTKSLVLGALSGGFACAPIAYLHYVIFSVANSGGIAQWEFVTDMSSIQAALFAIVYRYAVRKNDNNPMLNQGVVGAFVLVRTLSTVHVSATCQSIPLRCKFARLLLLTFNAIHNFCGISYFHPCASRSLLLVPF